MSNYIVAGTLVLLSLAATGCQTASTLNTEALSYNSALAAKPEAKPYEKMIEKYAGEYGVPIELAHAVIYTESKYRPDARGLAGEIGLMQLKLATARGEGYSGSAKALYDPETNIRFGMSYLGKAHKLSGGTTCGTILKYNAGHAAKSMNPVSKAYCDKVAELID